MFYWNKQILKHQSQQNQDQELTGSDPELLIAKLRLIMLIVVQKTVKCKSKCANP